MCKVEANKARVRTTVMACQGGKQRAQHARCDTNKGGYDDDTDM